MLFFMFYNLKKEGVNFDFLNFMIVIKKHFISLKMTKKIPDQNQTIIIYFLYLSLKVRNIFY